MNKKGMLIVISGFSGVGKGTVMKLIMSELKLSFSVSCATRPPREGEVDGVNYYFITVDQFKQKIADGEFIEYANTFGNYYGTLKSEVINRVEAGEDILLELNVVGALNIKRIYPDSVLIFIVPPSFDELKERLIGRGTETPKTLNDRLGEIDHESGEIDKYDYVVVNEVPEVCAAEIINIIKAEKAKR